MSETTIVTAVVVVETIVLSREAATTSVMQVAATEVH